MSGPLLSAAGIRDDCVPLRAALMPNSSLPKRTLTFKGKKTSVRLEDDRQNRGKPVSYVAVAAIDEQRKHAIISHPPFGS